MEETERRVEVLRMGHRPKRDERMTSHVGLTSRALGADRIHIASSSEKPRETIESVTERFGGDFEVKLTEKPRSIIRGWEGDVVHLTMYGLPIQDVIDEVRQEDVLVVVGSQKVPGYVYGLSDYNVGVTNQPHSEVAGLSVFLHEYFEGAELENEFEGGEIEVVPSNGSKKTVEKE